MRLKLPGVVCWRAMHGMNNTLLFDRYGSGCYFSGLGYDPKDIGFDRDGNRIAAKMKVIVQYPRFRGDPEFRFISPDDLRGDVYVEDGEGGALTASFPPSCPKLEIVTVEEK